MYGMVNRAMEKLVVECHGEAQWTAIVARADIGQRTFASLQSYPDALTYALVGAAAEVLGVPADDLLRAFGRYWIEFAAGHGYRELIGGPGTDLAAFLKGLDAMHARVGLSFPELRPPSFRCTDVSPGALRLHYHSDRPGLQPFVAGLVEGLGERFGVDVSVALEATRGPDHDHDVFQVSWSSQ